MKSLRSWVFINLVLYEIYLILELKTAMRAYFPVVKICENFHLQLTVNEPGCLQK